MSWHVLFLTFLWETRKLRQDENKGVRYTMTRQVLDYLLPDVIKLVISVVIFSFSQAKPDTRDIKNLWYETLHSSLQLNEASVLGTIHTLYIKRRISAGFCFVMCIVNRLRFSCLFPFISSWSGTLLVNFRPFCLYTWPISVGLSWLGWTNYLWQVWL